jgi:hypothetical protein
MLPLYPQHFGSINQFLNRQTFVFEIQVEKCLSGLLQSIEIIASLLL